MTAGRPSEDRGATPTGNGSVSPISDEVVILDAGGVRTLALLPTIPENAPYKVREGLARRRVTLVNGTCPCGAVANHLAATGGGVVEVEHDRLCPADTDRLVKAIRRWKR